MQKWAKMAEMTEAGGEEGGGNGGNSWLPVQIEGVCKQLTDCGLDQIVYKKSDCAH